MPFETKYVQSFLKRKQAGFMPKDVQCVEPMMIYGQTWNIIFVTMLKLGCNHIFNEKT